MALPHALTKGMKIPLVAAPMFILSNPELVIAQCTSGIIGSFPALNARPQGLLDEWLSKISTALDEHDKQNPSSPSASYAVNQIVHKTNSRLEGDMELCVKHKVPVVITSLGARQDINDAVHSYGGITLHDVVNNTFAKKAIEKGADGLIAVASGAGGHAGTTSPFALIQEIREWFDGPLLLSGSIGHGRAIAAANILGADLGYAGSIFIPAAETNAEKRYKEMVVECDSQDIVYSNLFTGIHGNYLKPSISAAGLDPDNLSQGDPSHMNFHEPGKMNIKAWKDIWGCGQGINTSKSIRPVSDIVEQLGREYAEAKQNFF